METKDLIIGCFMGTNIDAVNIWSNSIKQSGFSGDTVLILINSSKQFEDQIRNKNLIIVHKKLIEDRVDIYSQRFYHIYQYLTLKNKYRYVITTDVTDVIFQKDPSVFVHNNILDNKLILNGESILIKDESWNYENIVSAYGSDKAQTILSNEVKNVGVIAGNQKQVKDLCEHIYNMAKILNSRPSDQAVLNMSKISNSIVLNIDDGWVCNSGVIFCPQVTNNLYEKLLTSPPYVRDGILYNSLDKEVCIVHQYNRNEEFLKNTCQKYLDIPI